MEGSKDHRDPWENSEALEMVAEMLSFVQKSCVTTPQLTLDDLLFVGSRIQCVPAIRTHIA